MDKVASSSNNK